MWTKCIWPSNVTLNTTYIIFVSHTPTRYIYKYLYSIWTVVWRTLLELSRGREVACPSGATPGVEDNTRLHRLPSGTFVYRMLPQHQPILISRVREMLRCRSYRSFHSCGATMATLGETNVHCRFIWVQPPRSSRVLDGGTRCELHPVWRERPLLAGS